MVRLLRRWVGDGGSSYDPAAGRLAVGSALQVCVSEGRIKAISAIVAAGPDLSSLHISSVLGTDRARQHLRTLRALSGGSNHQRLRIEGQEPDLEAFLVRPPWKRFHGRDPDRFPGHVLLRSVLRRWRLDNIHVILAAAMLGPIIVLVLLALIRVHLHVDHEGVVMAYGRNGFDLGCCPEGFCAWAGVVLMVRLQKRSRDLWRQAMICRPFVARPADQTFIRLSNRHVVEKQIILFFDRCATDGTARAGGGQVTRLLCHQSSVLDVCHNDVALACSRHVVQCKSGHVGLPIKQSVVVFRRLDHEAKPHWQVQAEDDVLATARPARLVSQPCRLRSFFMSARTPFEPGALHGRQNTLDLGDFVLQPQLGSFQLPKLKVAGRGPHHLGIDFGVEALLAASQGIGAGVQTRVAGGNSAIHAKLPFK